MNAEIIVPIWLLIVIGFLIGSACTVYGMAVSCRYIGHHRK